ncbi:hypothetical protein P245_19800 [Comamonas thiooxydans]|uniref:Uncharacterized protein n=1 Tax=Comamonas thiooxydans TaxID=363952 RepID=A0A0E3BBE9_9BURK|nr:hypothetical protein [Comamonas thiooxydans]KGG87698.1 hypothetical protein P245_19800 [Comamonas thiooxydans]
MKQIQKLSTVVLTVVVAIVATCFAAEYSEFKQQAQSKADDVWYSASWLRSPVTNLMLSGHVYRDYWKNNAVGNERWHVREVEYNGTTFWTTLSREPIPNS